MTATDVFLPSFPVSKMLQERVVVVSDNDAKV